MAERVDTRPQSPHGRIQRIFELAHVASGHLQDVEPIVLHPLRYESLCSHAKLRREDFMGRVALWQHHHHQPASGNPVGLHVVHPEANVNGSFYHASRPNVLTFDLTTLYGNDSYGQFFTAEMLSVRRRPTSISSLDISLQRISHGNLRMQPMSIAIGINILGDLENRFTRLLEQPDTADTIRELIAFEPDVADR